MLAPLLALLHGLTPAPTSTPAEWRETRAKTIATIWADGKLPTRATPDAHVPNASVPGLSKLTWSITDESGTMSPATLNSTVYHSLRKPGAKRSSSTVVVHHHGHAKECGVTPPDSRCDGPLSWYDFYNLTDFFHREIGIDYYMVYMPLFGPNEQQGLPVAHQWFEQWELKGVRTIRFFMEPIILTINHALSLGYDRILMTGKSGGGWSTTLAAAIDSRIAFSFPIAGSIPLDFHHISWDYEQMPRNGTWYPAPSHWYLSACNYTCLYTLGALEQQRYQLQMLHENDPCCYYGHDRHEGIEAYDASISAELRGLGGGGFQTVVSNWNVHAVCQMDRLMIKTALDRQAAAAPRAPSFDKLPCDMLEGSKVPCPHAAPNLTAPPRWLVESGRAGPAASDAGPRPVGQPPDGPVVLCDCEPDEVKQQWGLGMKSGKATAVYSLHGEIAYCLTFDENRTLTLESCVNPPTNDLFTFGGATLPNIQYLGLSARSDANGDATKYCLAWEKGVVGERVTFAPEDDDADQFFLFDDGSSTFPEHIVAVMAKGKGSAGLCLTVGGKCKA